MIEEISPGQERDRLLEALIPFARAGVNEALERISRARREGVRGELRVLAHPADTAAWAICYVHKNDPFPASLDGARLFGTVVETDDTVPLTRPTVMAGSFIVGDGE